MSRLVCVALVLICITVADVESQSTIADTERSCPDDEYPDLLLKRNQRLAQTLEGERQLVEEFRKRIATLEKTATCIGNLSFLKTLNSLTCNNGVAHSDDKIYTLQDGPKSLHVYNDRDPFAIQKSIPISEVKNPEDLAYSNVSRCLYITDKDEKCIWKIDLRNDRVTKWLHQISEPFTLSVSTEGNVLILKENGSMWQLEIYGSDAVLHRRLQLPSEIHQPKHAIQTPSGDFIIAHYNARYSSTLSKLSSEGHIVNRFVPKSGESERFILMCHLAFDPVYNRLFALDINGNKVSLLDADLTWSRTLLSKDKNGISTPTRICYNPGKSQLTVGMWCSGTKVFEIN